MNLIIFVKFNQETKATVTNKEILLEPGLSSMK